MKLEYKIIDGDHSWGSQVIMKGCAPSAEADSVFAGRVAASLGVEGVAIRGNSDTVAISLRGRRKVLGTRKFPDDTEEEIKAKVLEIAKAIKWVSEAPESTETEISAEL